MKNTLLIIIALILVLGLCACGKQQNAVSYDVTPNTQSQQTTVTQSQPDTKEPKGVYKGILTEYYDFGQLAPSDFELKYGKADSINAGGRTTEAVQGSDRFEFNSKGLYYASISSSTFKGPGGIKCGMTLEETIRTFLPDHAESFNFGSDEFQSIFGQSYYDDYMGVTLVSPYCVYYRLGVEDATEDGTYILRYSVSSDYGTEEITMYFSIDKILSAYSMQLV